MAIIDDLIQRWKTPTKEEQIDLTQPAPPPTFTPADRILPSQWDETASDGKRADGSPLVNGQRLRQAWENTVAKNRDGSPSPYIDTTTGYGVNADGTSERPVFNVTPQQADEIREAADRGESFVSIYNRVLKRPEDIDPKMIENRRKLATLADVGAVLADVLGVAIGGNSAARKPSVAVNNEFLQNLLDKREQLQMLYDRGLLEAAFRDKAADAAAAADEAGRAYEQAMAIWKRQNEIDDRQADMDFKAGENAKDRALKEKLNRENNATSMANTEARNNTRFATSRWGKPIMRDDLYEDDEKLYFTDGTRGVILKSERNSAPAGVYNAVVRQFKGKKNDAGEEIIPLGAELAESFGNGPDRYQKIMGALQRLIEENPEVEAFVKDYMQKRNFTIYSNGIVQTWEGRIWDSQERYVNDLIGE